MKFRLRQSWNLDSFRPKSNQWQRSSTGAGVSRHVTESGRGLREGGVWRQQQGTRLGLPILPLLHALHQFPVRGRGDRASVSPHWWLASHVVAVRGGGGGGGGGGGRGGVSCSGVTVRRPSRVTRGAFRAKGVAGGGTALLFAAGAATVTLTRKPSTPRSSTP